MIQCAANLDVRRDVVFEPPAQRKRESQPVSSRSIIQTPLFLVGCERSGSTMLRLMLDAHPQLAFQHESDYLVSQIECGRIPDLNDYHAFLETDRVFTHSGLHLDRSLTFRELVDDFLDQKRQQAGTDLVGATVHHSFERLLQLWPDARFIHLLRDPRDVSRSVIDIGWAGHLWHAAEWWVEAEMSWSRLQKDLEPNSYVEVRYKDLVSEPAEQLARICRLVGLDYTPAMLEYGAHTSYEPPDLRRVDQWRRILTEFEIAAVEARVGNLLLDRGFEASGVPDLQPARARRALWTLRSRVGRARFRLRKYGPSLFSQDLVARRLKLSQLEMRARRRLDAIDQSSLT